MDKNNIMADKITTEYVNVNGKIIKFTPEQKEALVSALDSPFTRKVGERFYFVGQYMEVDSAVDFEIKKGDMYSKGNYCTDENIMYQHALHMELYSMLWRLSMVCDGDKMDWKDGDKRKYTFFYDYESNEFKVASAYDCKYIGMYFNDKETAEAAIEEIIKPFMEKHPDFDWAAM